MGTILGRFEIFLKLAFKRAFVILNAVKDFSVIDYQYFTFRFFHCLQNDKSDLNIR